MGVGSDQREKECVGSARWVPGELCRAHRRQASACSGWGGKLGRGWLRGGDGGWGPGWDGAMLQGALLWPHIASGSVHAAKPSSCSHRDLGFPKPLGPTCPRRETGSGPEALSDIPNVDLVYLEDAGSFGIASLHCSLPAHHHPHPQLGLPRQSCAPGIELMFSGLSVRFRQSSARWP